MHQGLLSSHADQFDPNICTLSDTRVVRITEACGPSSEDDRRTFQGIETNSRRKDPAFTDRVSAQTREGCSAAAEGADGAGDDQQ
jgi:hypothetical protein